MIGPSELCIAEMAFSEVWYLNGALIDQSAPLLKLTIISRGHYPVTAYGGNINLRMAPYLEKEDTLSRGTRQVLICQGR